MDLFFGQLQNGLVLGALYALIALGYTMVYGIIQLINFAHGEIFMIGAFGSLAVFTLLGSPQHLWVLVPMILGGMVAAVAISVIMERFAYRPLRHAPRLAPLITAIGVSVFLQESIRLWQGGAAKPYPSLLSGNAGGIATRLSTASAYANQATNLANIGDRYGMWQQTIGHNVTTLGRTLGIQDSQQQTNAALIERMQAQSGSATGQMQAIQAGNQLAAATASQLMQVQATLSATAQMQATNMAVAADRRAAEDAAMQYFNRTQNIPTTGGRAW